MSAPASLRTGRHRRRALLAILVAPLAVLGIVTGSGTAHASTAGLFIPAQNYAGQPNECSVSGWPNGIIWCGTGIGVTFPNGHQEVFGTGLNDAVWTDWGTEANPSGWKSMGGQCGQGFNLGLSSEPGTYGLTLYCVGGNADYWYKTRGSGVNAGWSGWNDTGVPWPDTSPSSLPAGILWSNGQTN
jgi:hypothetical protein